MFSTSPNRVNPLFKKWPHVPRQDQGQAGRAGVQGGAYPLDTDNTDNDNDTHIYAYIYILHYIHQKPRLGLVVREEQATYTHIVFTF